MDFLPRTSLPLPLKEEGRGIVFPGLVGFALLVHNGATLAQQGLFGASVVSFFPTRLSKSHTGPHRGEFGTHFLFLVRLGFGRADRSFSSL